MGDLRTGRKAVMRQRRGTALALATLGVLLMGTLLAPLPGAGAAHGAPESESRLYLVLNLAGSLVLGLDAWHERQWGFLLLEGVWALVSAWSLTRSPATGPASG